MAEVGVLRNTNAKIVYQVSCDNFAKLEYLSITRCKNLRKLVLSLLSWLEEYESHL